MESSENFVTVIQPGGFPEAAAWISVFFAASILNRCPVPGGIIMMASPEFYVGALFFFLLLHFLSVRFNTGKWVLINDSKLLKNNFKWSGSLVVYFILLWNLMFFLWIIDGSMVNSNYIPEFWQNNLYLSAVQFGGIILGNAIISWYLLVLEINN